NYSEGNRKLAQSNGPNGDSSDVKGIDENTAKRVWSYCTKDFKDMDSDLSQSTISSYDGVEFDSTLLPDLPPKKKESILECLRENNLPSQKLRAKQETLLNENQNQLSSSANVRRRYLMQKRLHHGVVKIEPTPVSLAPSPSPSPSPVKAPKPSPPRRRVNPSPPSHINHPPPENIPSRNNNNNNVTYLVVAIVASIVAGAALVAVVLLLCLNKKNEPIDGKTNAKPPLNFGASYISSGNTSNKDFKAPSMLIGSLATIQDSSKVESADAKSFEKTNANLLPLPPGRTTTPIQEPPAPPPPPPPPKPPAPAPPPPPKVSRPPPKPPVPGIAKPSPLGLHNRGRSSIGEASEVSDESDAPKTKLKPFFWDKVLASPNHSMVWHEIQAGSFQFNEEMMETLFGYVPADNKNQNQVKKETPSNETPQFIQIIDPKKSQNLAILLRALNVTTDEVCTALEGGNELPPELIQTLLKMAPTTEEELKLRLYSGDVTRLGPAERFLKVMVDIPFAFKRLESLLFISTFQEEVSSIKESLATLEVACKELKNSRLFLKLLEAVLKTGNRMNDGTYRGGAQAFKLETLLKLSDVKGTDGKTTLLHFVVQEIIRSEGIRAARKLRESQNMSSLKTEDLIEADAEHETEDYHRSLGLQVVSGLSSELENVKKAAQVDKENLSASLFKLGQSLVNAKKFVENEMKSIEGKSDFRDVLDSFVKNSESDVTWLLQEEKRIMELVKSTGDYFHGKAGKDEAARLFVIVRDFLLMLDKACKDVKSTTKFPSKAPRKESSTSQEPRHESVPDYRKRLFPAIRERQMDDDFSSDDES
ncbi:hypothetical protein RD792_007453, partial [Penstemon davidsonii]